MMPVAKEITARNYLKDEAKRVWCQIACVVVTGLLINWILCLTVV